MLNAKQDKTKHGIYFIFSVLALPLLHSLHSLHSSLPRYLTKTLLYTKQPTQKPAALSNQVNKLQVSAIAATAALNSFSLISSLNWTMMKQDRASINPTPSNKIRIRVQKLGTRIRCTFMSNNTNPLKLTPSKTLRTCRLPER